MRSCVSIVKPPKRPSAELFDEIRGLEKNIAQTENTLNRMVRIFRESSGVCCPMCAFGSRWSSLELKLTRRYARLEYLLGRVRRWEGHCLRAAAVSNAKFY